MTCSLAPDRIEATIRFHGHVCPGLAIGIRAAELALRDLDAPEATNLVAVAETDMCGVDAIQFLTGCTLGKGNLILRDHGKMAFSFYRRDTGQAFRALLNPDVRAGMDEEMGVLMQIIADGTATPQQHRRSEELRELLRQRFMALPLEEMFHLAALPPTPPRPARILTSLACGMCGEATMESRTRRFGGRTLCIPCFLAMEQKI